MIDAATGLAKWVRMLCAFALLSVGFAHPPPAVGAHAVSQAELARYAFPDGSLPVLCLPGGDDEAKGTMGYGNGCAACRLNADLVLPAPADMAGSPLLHPADPAAPPGAEPFARRILPPNSTPRAPPSGLPA